MTKSWLLGLVLSAAMLGLAGTAHAEGNIENGEKVYKKCKACHATEAGKNKVGPTLAGLIGRQAGTLEGFKFSKAMIAYGESGIVWDEENLVTYLEKPRKLVKGTKMAFAGLKKEQDRRDVVAYIMQFSQ